MELHYRWFIRTIAPVTLWMAGSWNAAAQAPLPLTTPKQAFGFNIGDDYSLVNYTQMLSYWQRLAQESDRVQLVDMGATAEGRRQVMAVISSPANLKQLETYKNIAQRMAHADDLTEEEARALARTGKSVVWIDGGLHANEVVGSQQLIEMVYQMATRTDDETMRFLNDTIQLYVPANPDGQELVADWYMREPDPLKRSTGGVPRLYEKYAGHDDNRDFFLSALPETTNVNRQLFLEWFPQIVYNHHQAGPAGTVVFIPPFRDPYNYNLDPLVPIGIEMVGSAMHSRLLAEGKPGSTMRDGASYSAWWNGGLRTVSNFHNMIGLLTEIIGNPTPMEIPFIPSKHLAQSTLLMPPAPGRWYFRQSIEYEITQNRAVLDYASKYREDLLLNMYRMGRNSIARGSEDAWTITPKRIAAVQLAAAGNNGGNGGGNGNNNRVAPELYERILHDPAFRDPRGYIIPADQRDFPTAVKFANSLIKTGITVMRASSEFRVAGKLYPAESLIVKTAQAFRPHVLDMFEPQDHPDDFAYPGGPPIPPYDIAGWTLAMQMGVEFDRILDAFDGPFEKIPGEAVPPPGLVTGATTPGAYCLGHNTNNAFIAVNRLLQAQQPVYSTQSGEFCSPSSATTTELLFDSAAKLGVSVRAAAALPPGNAKRLARPRIGLYDQYGGSAPSGWLRYLMEQFEFPFVVVYAGDLDAGQLRSRFDVLLLADGAYPERAQQPRPETIPEEYRNRLGRITPERTIPELKTFVESGGSVLTIGSATQLAMLVGAPLESHLTRTLENGTKQPLRREEFYVPGSLLKMQIDTTQPLAQGMPSEAVAVFDNSPVFRATDNTVKVIARFGGQSLASGWAWGQEHLADGIAVADAPVGEGHLILFGPEVAFRAQPHGTFPLLFNGLLYSAAEEVMLP